MVAKPSQAKPALTLLAQTPTPTLDSKAHLEYMPASMLVQENWQAVIQWNLY